MAQCALRLRATKLSCAFSVVLVLGACEESPTGPSSLVRSVAGTEWVAISIPEQLPDLGVWVKDPSPQAFLNSFSALSSWSDRVRAEIPIGEVAALDSTLAAIEVDVDVAVEALERADTTLAARHMAHAGEAVREFGPDRVAASLLERIEERLNEADLEGPDSSRAEHLIRGAHEAVREGDSMRALRRGLYVLQLSEGHGIPRAECSAGDEGCGTP